MNDAKALNEQLLSGLEALRAQVTGLEQAGVMNVEAESALRQELAMTQRYLDLAGVILIALNPQGEITLINAKGCDVLGWEKEALLGQNWFDMCLPHEDRARVRDVFQQLVAGVIEPVEFFENPVLTRSGEQRLIAWRNAVLTNGSGHIVGILSSGEDITEHRQAREALRESTERYQSLFNRVPIGLYKTTHEGQIVDANPALVDMLGYPDRESLLMTRVQDLFVNLEDRQTEQEQLEQEDIIQCFQMQLRRYDGTIVWVEDNVRSILNGDGRAYYEGSLTDITNRKQAELALLESETRFRSVAQAAPDAIITADNQGHIVFWNEAAEDMFGYETDEVIGQSLTRIMPTRYREQHTAGMTRFLATNESTMIGRQVELVGLRHDGREFPLEFTLAAWGVGDHAFFSAILRDVTDRKRAEEALRRRDALLETLASFSELLLRSTDLDAVLPDALARLGEAARVSRAHIFENHTAPDGALLTTCRYEWVKPSPESPISLLSLQNVAYDDDFARWVGLLSQGQPLYGLVRDLPARERATLEAQGIVSQATVPIFAGEDWWGFLGFDDCDRERDWLPAEIEALRNIASVFGAALVRQRAEQAERDQRLLAEALRDTATALNSTLDLNEVLDNILSNLERALPHDTASVMIIESSGIARAVRSHGYNEFGIPDSPTDAVYRLRINDLVGLRRMVEDKRPLLFPDVETEAEWVHLEDDPTSLRSYLAAPILWNGDVIGFLTLRSVTPGFFTPEDTPRLQAFADQVATALHNAQLFAAERDQRLLAETLTETASVLTSALDVTTVLDRILESVERVVPHDAANIMLLDGTIIRVAARRGYQQEKSSEAFLCKHRFTLDAPHLREMFETGQPVLIPDTARFSGWERRPDTAWIRSYAAAPILVQGQVVGFLNLDGREPGFFTQEHIHRLQTFAAQASIAIEHAHLYQELEAYNQSLEQAVIERTAELRASEARYRTITRHLPNGLIHIFDRDLHFVFSDGEELRNLGLTNEMLLGKTLYELFDPEVLPPVEENYRRVLQGESVRLEVDLGGRSYLVYAAPLPNPDGESDQILVLGVNITERKQAEEKLRLSDLILTNMGEGVYLVRTDGTIAYTNPRFEQMFGYGPGELVGQHVSIVNAPTDKSPEETANAIMHALREHGHWHGDLQNIKKDGTVFWSDVHVTTFEHSEHGPVWITIHQDITERKRAEDQLRQMLAHETELSELKSRYVSMAAHDLRNPLAVIRSTIDLIDQYGNRLTDEKLQEKYEQVQSTINVMVATLDDILVLGKTESGKLTFDPAPLDVVDFCQSMVAEIVQAADTPSRIVFSSQGNHHSAHMDAKLLRHILGNLLSNAIKYSPPTSSVTFSLDCGQDQITFRIQDHGIGIPEDDQKHLFEAFHRASNTGQVPGTGLGLAIVKQSVELHAGTIVFESEENVGTIFTVSVPRLAGA